MYLPDNVLSTKDIKMNKVPDSRMKLIFYMLVCLCVDVCVVYRVGKETLIEYVKW